MGALAFVAILSLFNVPRGTLVRNG